MPEVTEPSRAEEGVGDGVGEGIGIGPARQARCTGDGHAAEDQLPGGVEGVDVEAHPNPHLSRSAPAWATPSWAGAPGTARCHRGG